MSYSERALADLTKLTDFLVAIDAVAATETIALITDAVELLRRHPLVGRPAEHGLRELVISRGQTGYLAMYSFDERGDVVLILAIRHQREVGYARVGTDRSAGRTSGAVWLASSRPNSSVGSQFRSI